ncbi:MAG: insulinase family protein [Deltaproteobacteria bacterium]|nr:insulinase family protein [Deltaproteobacteria bacterium]
MKGEYPKRQESGKGASGKLHAIASGEKLHGFYVLRVEAVPDIRVVAHEMVHEKTGAKVLHLHAEERENLFAIGFRTPPFDSTGVPHILEHSVLAGSERYPLKDVFNELHRGTLQTFINAFTYPDKTIYPVASQVKKDFFNLARVYTDLVLRPRLLPETFAQEGHHLEFLDPEDPGSELTTSGIVYNEMKGAYSSPDSLMYKTIQENLYPDVPYRFDSGGDPEAIPTLTYERFKDFHRLYYSPSNARVFLYGDIPTAEHLVFLEEMFSGFERVECDSVIHNQPRWRQPLSVRAVYPIGPQEEIRGKTIVNMAWMTVENEDSETALLVEILAGLLVGTAAGPLRKALIDSGLGEDLSPATGLERDLKQILFAVGLRGTDPEKAPRIEALILETLQRIAGEGFDRELIEGTLHQIEFHGREIVRGGLPYGIALMGRVFHSWLYDGDPLANLHFSRLIEKIRRRWEEKPALFQEGLRRWLIDNPHRLLAVMEPDRDYARSREETFRKKMAEFRASHTTEDLESIRRQAMHLRVFQTEPDSPEAVAALPRLQIGDISRAVETVPTEQDRIDGVPLLVHDIFANGIAYLDMAFDVSDVPEELQPYLPLLGRLSLGMGAASYGYEEMAKRIANKTGGLGYSLAAGFLTGGRGTWQKMIFRVKTLHRNLAEAVELLADILTAGDLSHEARMRDLILEGKNKLHASVVPSGHVFARRTAASSLSLPLYRDEQWHGRTQLLFAKSLADGFNRDVGNIQEKLQRLREMVFRRGRMLINFTADGEGIDLLKAASEELIGRMAEGGPPEEVLPPFLQTVHAGIAVPAQVSYVAKAFKAPPYGDPLSASLYIAARYLSNGYLYKHVRVQGGAYGGMVQYDPLSGSLAFLSYRDPRIVETLKVYREATAFAMEEKAEGGELEKTIIGTIGTLDRPMDPSHRGYVAMIRHFAELTDEVRQRFRDAILETTARSLRESLVRYFKEALPTGVMAVYGAEDHLRKANDSLKEKLVLTSLLGDDVSERRETE